jgi:hypothetical protein
MAQASFLQQRIPTDDAARDWADLPKDVGPNSQCAAPSGAHGRRPARLGHRAASSIPSYYERCESPPHEGSVGQGFAMEGVRDGKCSVQQAYEESACPGMGMMGPSTRG